MPLQVDGEFIARLLRFLDVLHLLPEGDLTNDPPPASPIPLYCNRIFISPVDMRLTVSNPHAATQDLPTFFRTIGIAVPSINAAPFNLSECRHLSACLSVPACACLSACVCLPV